MNKIPQNSSVNNPSNADPIPDSQEIYFETTWNTVHVTYNVPKSRTSFKVQVTLLQSLNGQQSRATLLQGMNDQKS